MSNDDLIRIGRITKNEKKKRQKQKIKCRAKWVSCAQNHFHVNEKRFHFNWSLSLGHVATTFKISFNHEIQSVEVCRAGIFVTGRH